MHPSEYPDIYIWSKPRFGALSVLFGLAGYFLFSMFRRSLTHFNNYLTYVMLGVLIMMEILLRVVPTFIPTELLLYVPKSIRTTVITRQGYIREGMLSAGTNRLLYHFNPQQRIDFYPHVHIDELGYRNSVHNITQADIVLLGDSLTLAFSSDEDLADLFRHSGFSALNLGMFGYSPQHYRDAYQELVIKRGIKHNYVLVFMFVGNDFAEAYRYEQVARVGGDYRAYLPQFAEVEAAYEGLSVVMNLARGVPGYLRSKLFTSKARTIKLPYKSIKTTDLWPPPQITEQSTEWRHVADSLDEIAILSRSHGAVPVALMFPSPAVLYSKYDESLKKYDQAYQIIVSRLSRHLAQNGVLFVDLNEYLSQEMDRHFIYAAESDCHFNTLGVHRTFEVVQAYLKSLASQ